MVSSLVPIKPSGSSAPLFLVHDLNGAVGRYVELARRLGPDQPLVGLRYTREHETIESMAEQYLHEIRTVQPEGPYRLGGWCFGAVVAFEIARQLHAADDEVTLLALIGISAFDYPRLVSPAAWRRYQAKFSSRLDRRIRSHVSAAHALSLREGSFYLYGPRQGRSCGQSAAADRTRHRSRVPRSVPPLQPEWPMTADHS